MTASPLAEAAAWIEVQRALWPCRSAPLGGGSSRANSRDELARKIREALAALT